jgi:enhancer of yellow 2 transcription factor
VTADEIVRHVRPEGRAAVPDNIKAELLTRIKSFILQL